MSASEHTSPEGGAATDMLDSIPKCLVDWSLAPLDNKQQKAEFKSNNSKLLDRDPKLDCRAAPILMGRRYMGNEKNKTKTDCETLINL